MTEVVKVEGLQQLAHALKQLPIEIAAKNGGPLARALRAAAWVIRDKARGQAPKAAKPYVVSTKSKTVKVHPGRLRESIIAVRARRPAGGVNEQYVIKPFGRNIRKKYGVGVAYWHLLEFGFTARNGQKIHKPFLRPAFNASRQSSLEEFKRHMRAGIERARKKIYKRI